MFNVIFGKHRGRNAYSAQSDESMGQPKIYLRKNAVLFSRDSVEFICINLGKRASLSVATFF